ncbi:conjugative relaxase [Sphingobium sp. TA15]|uniref:TraI/trwC-like protein n=1 Tax=Sphingobium indicum (strain DSM 16413 / CCM 7287 / MTCC 6362 / UT26 / NBRC 101211 / UT26S) TaxID=452662 RepID=D4Z204_SPHIU|nr:MobF family relaxase [Sphingobium indicum]BAI96636.1 traI/trwC-like protein [Sphingobium indicum UT26S]BDD65924.1 conjugative relaxase [Sphingobium sp. TA15]
MINPVRLHGKPANIARYYTVGDYYTKGAEEHSEWGGKIAAELGLEGKVDPQMFKELLAGKVGDQQLGRHRQNGEIEHHPGWDFAVNAPKSISIMALVMGDERILAAHERAVTSALNYLEEHATLRRRVDGEIIHETTGRFVVARFTEHASREQDPHLHTHAVIMNMTNREDGASMASLETRAMFAEQMVAGQIYRNDLARDVIEQGHEIEFDPRTGLWELAHFPKELLLGFSRRGEQINEHAKENGFSGQAERQRSFYATRGPKVKIGLDDLNRQWTDRSQPFRQFLESVAARAEEKERPPEVDPVTIGRAALFGIRQAETREAVNNRGRILRLGLASHVGDVRASDLLPQLEMHEERRKLLATRAPTGDQILTRGRTTRRTARLELALTQHLALSLDDARPITSSDRLLLALESAGLKPAQEQALVDVATSRDRVAGIHGVAGSGKSTLVRTLAEATESGTILLALAPTSSAAADLGRKANIESRTVASLLAGGGFGITDRHVLVVDEAGQLGNRQALRVLEISRATGARVLLLGDNKQTGAIEQGKAFWLLQKLGMPTAQLTEAIRQETKVMKAAVAQARAGDYAASLASLDKVVSGESADKLAKALVDEWTRLKPENRANTNILVLDNATRLIVNTQIREVLKREGVVAAEDTRLSVLTASGMTDEEKRNARFYSGGQVVTFGRDIAGAGIARETEYRVIGLGRDANGRQIVRLVDENGRIIRWDPRLGSARQVNVFNRDERDLAEGDRVQWRLANKDLQLKNAERGTVEKLDGPIATIRWDRDDRAQQVDLSVHKTWDHGYSETVYSAQSKTYDRVYVLAPVNSGLVNGQNYYTAITRAQYGVKLWTEDVKRLAQRLAQRSGEKTSSLEGLGRLDRDKHSQFSERHPDHLRQTREEQEKARQERRDSQLERQLDRRGQSNGSLADRLAGGARSIAEVLDRFLQSVLDRGGATDPHDAREAREDRASPAPSQQPEPSQGPER